VVRPDVAAIGNNAVVPNSNDADTYAGKWLLCHEPGQLGQKSG
jgi:hypothetical protein